jgi:ankyrin repeat protein
MVTCTVQAIVIRHDVEDKKYLELGEEYTESVAYVAGCAATLIDRSWLLTAAHCLEGKEDDIFTARHVDTKYRVERIFIHPKFKRINDEVYDAALVQLKDPIDAGKPALLNQQKNEVGQQVIFVGRGTFGNGRDGLIRDDAKQRGATNTVSSANEYVIGFTFDKPNIATKYEGVSSRGDSGGPAFVIVDNNLIVIGISSYQLGNGFAEGHYGVGEYYTRVSSIYPWLRGVINNTEPALLPNHPIIDAVVNNDFKALNKAITESALSQEEVVNEAFYQSVVLNHIKIANALIKHGAKFENVVVNKDSLFAFALINKRKDYFRMLQDAVRDNTKVHDSNSAILPLFISSYRKDAYLLEGAQLLIKRGANLDAQTKAGDTGLILAGWSTNNFELVKLLVSNGADLNIANNNGDTPTIDAAYLGKLENLRYLLERGADTSLKNKNGKTALDVAKSNKNNLAAELLSLYQQELK